MSPRRGGTAEGPTRAEGRSHWMTVELPVRHPPWARCVQQVSQEQGLPLSWGQASLWLSPRQRGSNACSPQ